MEVDKPFALFLLSHQTGIMEHNGTTNIELVNAAHSYRKTNIEIANTGIPLFVNNNCI